MSYSDDKEEETKENEDDVDFGDDPNFPSTEDDNPIDIDNDDLLDDDFVGSDDSEY